MEFTPEVVAGFLSVFLTLVFAYFPVLRVKFAELASEIKSLIMLGLYLIFAGGIFALVFYKVIPSAEPMQWFDFVKLFVAMVVIGQPAYTILPMAADVKEAKLLRDYAVVEETFSQ